MEYIHCRNHSYYQHFVGHTLENSLPWQNFVRHIVRLDSRHTAHLVDNPHIVHLDKCYTDPLDKHLLDHRHNRCIVYRHFGHIADNLHYHNIVDLRYQEQNNHIDH